MGVGKTFQFIMAGRPGQSPILKVEPRVKRCRQKSARHGRWNEKREYPTGIGGVEGDESGAGRTEWQRVVIEREYGERKVRILDDAVRVLIERRLLPLRERIVRPEAGLQARVTARTVLTGRVGRGLQRESVGNGTEGSVERSVHASLPA